MRSGLRSASRIPSEPRSARTSPPKTANAGRCPAKAQAAAPAPDVSNARRFIPEKTERGGRPPRSSLVLLRLEDVAVEDRRDTEIRYIDQLRNVEINGHAGQHVSLL